MPKFFKDNGLTIVFTFLFLITLAGQAYTGLQEHNKEMQDLGGQAIGMGKYLTSGHFLQSTFENWESEFLQMGLYVVLTIFLFQKGSSESKDPEKREPVDRKEIPHRPDAPWPVKQGGIALALYRHSLSIVLFILFALSFIVHFNGSLRDEHEEQLLKGEDLTPAGDYIFSSRFWFECFQNWQSEFLSVVAIVVLSIFLRQKGSPQSKPVDEAHKKTGD